MMMPPGLSPGELEAAGPTGRSGGVPMGANKMISSRNPEEPGDPIAPDETTLEYPERGPGALRVTKDVK